MADPVEVVVSISDVFPRPVDYPTTDYDVARVTSDEPDPNAGGAAHAYAFWHGDECVGGLQFQHGPCDAEGSTPGAFQLQVIAALIDQFRGFMSGPYANDDTAASLRDLKAVRDRIVARRDARHARGALGTTKV